MAEQAGKQRAAKSASALEGGSKGADLGARVRALRQRQGLSQEDVAGAGVTAAYVSLIESGKRNPTKATIAHLAIALGTTPRYLQDGVDDDEERESQLALHYAELALVAGDAEEAERSFGRLCRHKGASAELRRQAEWGRARALEASGRLEQAIAAYERLATSRLEDPEFSVPVVTALSRCYREVGDFAHSIDLAERALTRVTELGLAGTDPEIQLAATLAAAYAERGDLVRATVVASQAVERAERFGSPRARGAAYWNASVLAHEAGRTDEAIALSDRAVALVGEGDDERNLARLRLAHAALLLRAQEPRVDEAMPLLERAHAALGETGPAGDLASCETELGRAHLLAGRPEEALDVTRQAVARLADGVRLERVPARVVLARALLASGAGDEAAEVLDAVVVDLIPLGPGRQVALAWREVGDAARVAGRIETALDAYARSLAAAGIVSETDGERTAALAAAGS